MIFLDTETCGYHGPIILLQYAEDDGPIHIHDVWQTPARATIELIERIVHADAVCGFNLAFDWFHLCQMYTTLSLIKDIDADIDPLEYALCEPKGRDGLCLKPMKALDLMLHARKGPYQSTMDRDDIVVKRIPTAIAWALADILDARVVLKDIYFARKENPKKRWDVVDIKDEPDFKNIVLRFAPSSALKALVQDITGIDTESIARFADVKPPSSSRPEECGWAPFALAVGSPDDWKGSWPEYGKLDAQIDHWTYNEEARQYASDDVKYLRVLYEHFGRPEAGDVDSELACLVAASRWRGYSIDVAGIKEHRKAAVEAMQSGGDFNFNSVEMCRRYITEFMSPTEIASITEDGKITTKHIVLEGISKWMQEKTCTACKGQGCPECGMDGTVKTGEQHPAALRAAEILSRRRAAKQVELYDKLLQAGLFHASLIIIGTRSSRMSGSDGLNPQGIQKEDTVRSCFTLARGGMSLIGGDFESFEVTIMDAAYGDPDLHAELMSGKKIHGLFGEILFHMPYDEVMATKNLNGDANKYGRAKNCVFALAYGGEAYTLENRGGVDKDTAQQAYDSWVRKYRVWGQKRQEIADMFCSMKQPGGIGTEVTWAEPADYIESMFGFRRYFTLENKICKVLYELANKPPKALMEVPLRVRRRERVQTAGGAARSALYGAAFALQAANMRAAGNHVIQSTGAEANKQLQCRLWSLQPHGIGEWKIQPLNIHDELMCPIVKELIPDARSLVKEYINELKKVVPLADIDWHDEMKTWADK